MSLLIKLRLYFKGVFVHRTALVNTSQIGKGSRVWAFVNICQNSFIGMNCNICDHCFIEENVRIGNNVTIKTSVSLWSGVIIEDNVFIGPGVQFCNDKYPKSKQYTDHLKTLLRDNCSIGSGSIILPGVTIGANSMVGAGSVVTKDIPDNAVAYGNPCKVHRYLDATENS